MAYSTITDIEEAKDIEFLKKLINKMKKDEVYATLVSMHGGKSLKFKKSELKERFPEGVAPWRIGRESPVLVKVWTFKELKLLLKSLLNKKRRIYKSEE